MEMLGDTETLGSGQVKQVSVVRVLIFAGQRLHDRLYSTREKRLLASKFCPEPSQQLQTALLSESGRRVAFRITLSRTTRKPAIHLVS